MITNALRVVMAVAVVAVLGAGDVMAKVSDDNRLFRQVDNINTAFKLCDLSTGPLDEIRSKAVATGVTGGVATVASTVATVSSAIAASKSGASSKSGKGKDATKSSNWNTNTQENRENVENLNDNLHGKRMVSTVASGIATGANAVSLGMSGTSWSNLKKLMSGADDCVRALDNISLGVPVRTEN